MSGTHHLHEGHQAGDPVGGKYVADAVGPPPVLICPTTGERFQPERYREQVVRGHHFLWIWCPLCDAYNRPHTDPNFDPTSPQIHCAHVLLERSLGG